MLSSVIWSVPIATGLAYIPHFVRGVIISKFGKLDSAKPRDESGTTSMPKHLQELAIRLKNCHFNQLESLGLYAGAVAVAVAANVPPSTMHRLTSWYLKSRLAYVLAYSAPQVAGGMLRSLSFVASITSCILLYAAAANTASISD